MAKWYLWLDDIRNPPGDDMNWRIARNYDDACWYVKNYGLPAMMSLDHDLGIDNYINLDISKKDGIVQHHTPTGMDFVKWLCEYIIKEKIKKPRKNLFQYHIHSQNPIGKINMFSYLHNFVEKGWK